MIVDLLQYQISQTSRSVSSQFTNTFSLPLALPPGQTAPITNPDGSRSDGNVIPPCGKAFIYTELSSDPTHPELKLKLIARKGGIPLTPVPIVAPLGFPRAAQSRDADRPRAIGRGASTRPWAQ